MLVRIVPTASLVHIERLYSARKRSEAELIRLELLVMRRYEDKEKTVVTKRECVEYTCDMCGRKADHPELDGMSFEWGGIGISSGTLKAEYSIDGDYEAESVDLCYECAEWIIDQVRARKIKRPDV